MVGINLIDAHSSQPILSFEDQTTFHEILTIMYHPPSMLDLFCNQFTSREDKPMCHLSHLVRVYAQLLTLYVCSLKIPEDHVLEMSELNVADPKQWLYNTVQPTACALLIFHPQQEQSTTTTFSTIPTTSHTSTTTTSPTIPTTSHTPILSQQLGSTRMSPLDTTTPAFTH